MEVDGEADPKVVTFSSPALLGTQRRTTGTRSDKDICVVFDLSQYEMRRDGPEDFRKRMIANMAALVLLTTFVSLAVADVHGIVRIERCDHPSECVLSGSY